MIDRDYPTEAELEYKNFLAVLVNQDHPPTEEQWAFKAQLEKELWGDDEMAEMEK